MAITKLIEKLPEDAWIRTCDECGHRQQDKEPGDGRGMTDAYRNRKCRACKSPALDYGSFNGSSEDWAEELP